MAEAESPFQLAQTTREMSAFMQDEDQTSGSSTRKKNKFQQKHFRKGYEIGETEELGTNVFEYGQQDKYTRSMEAFIKHTGKTVSKDMHDLLKNEERKDFGKEPKPPQATTKPATRQDAQPETVQPTSVEVQVWKTNLARWDAKTEAYKKEEEKTFMLLVGQCTNSLKAKLEAKTNWSDIEKKADVLKLKESIKELCHDSKVGNYAPFTAMKAAQDLYMIRQKPHEDLTQCQARFDSRHENYEAKVGKLTITEKAVGVTDEEAAEQHLACLFIANSDQQVHGKALADLNDLVLSKAVAEWPKTVADMKEHMSKKAVRVHPRGRTPMQFAQIEKDYSNYKCNYCKAFGHIKKNCPKLTDSQN